MSNNFLLGKVDKWNCPKLFSAEPYWLTEIPDYIIPGFKLMLFSEIPIEADVLSAMGLVDAAFIELTANDLLWNNKKESYLKSKE